MCCPTSDFGSLLSRNSELCEDMLSPIGAFADAAAEADGFVYLDTRNAPFVLGGIAHPQANCGEYYRLDASRKEDYTPDNRNLAGCTSGATVRFTTDAKRISVRVTLGDPPAHHSPHFPDRGIFGIDVQEGTGSARRALEEFMQTFAANEDVNEGVLTLSDDPVKEISIGLPLYAGVRKLEVGFPAHARVGAPLPRTNKPIVFYGSSITQGGCVSRPGCAYPNILCRVLDADCRNYGFSGSARGETAVCDHLSAGEMSAFVMDYDYNSDSPEHLSSTHEAFFRRFREKNPDIPVLIVVHPPFYPWREFDRWRYDIVRATYDHAVAAGDRNVYFVDSRAFFPEELRDLFAVEQLHPNSLGHYYMAKAIYPVLKKALG